MDITLPMSEVVSGVWRHFDRGQQKHVNLSSRFEIELSMAANQRNILEKCNSL